MSDSQTGRTIAGAEVRITEAPPEFISRLVTLARLAPLVNPPDAVRKANATLDNPTASPMERLQAAQVILDYLQATNHLPAERPDEARTAADGHFHFLDLPNGQYTLIASLPVAGTRYGTAQVQAEVARDGEKVKMAAADLALPPTMIKGQIKDQVKEQVTGSPVIMAEVRVKGSGERAFSDAQGLYRLVGLEAGPRTLQLFAQGYKPAVHAVDLGPKGAVLTLDWVWRKNEQGELVWCCE